LRGTTLNTKDHEGIFILLGWICKPGLGLVGVEHFDVDDAGVEAFHEFLDDGLLFDGVDDFGGDALGGGSASGRSSCSDA